MPNIDDLLINGTHNRYYDLIAQTNEYKKAWDAFGEYQEPLGCEQVNRLHDIICKIVEVSELFYYKHGLQDGAAIHAFLNNNDAA